MKNFKACKKILTSLLIRYPNEFRVK